MKKLLLLGALCAGFAVTSAEAQVLGGVRGNFAAIQMNSVDMPPTGPGPIPNPGPTPSRGPLSSLLISGPLGAVLDGPLNNPLPGLGDIRLRGIVRFGDDVIVRVGGIVGPAPLPTIPELGSAIPGIFSIGENVIVRVGGIVGPAPLPTIPGLGVGLEGLFSFGSDVIVRVGGIVGPAPLPTLPPLPQLPQLPQLPTLPGGQPDA